MFWPAEIRDNGWRKIKRQLANPCFMH